MLYRLLGGEPAGIELEDSDFQETVTKRSFFANSALIKFVTPLSIHFVVMLRLDEGSFLEGTTERIEREKKALQLERFEPTISQFRGLFSASAQ